MTQGAIESDGKDIFIVRDGKRIAKRGQPDTPEAGTWVTLVPGYTVTSNADHSEITIEFDGVERH